MAKQATRIWLGPWYRITDGDGDWGRPFLRDGQVWTKKIAVDRRPLHVLRPLRGRR